MSRKNVKTALVTGGAKRIGREIALSLAKNGWNIALHHNTTPADKVLKEIKAFGVEAIALKGNLHDHASVVKLIPRANAQLGEISLLVNNASIFEKIPFSETSEDVFDRHFGLHVKAPFFLAQEFAKQTKNGHIISIADAFTGRNRSKYFAYLASKKALRALNKMLAVELAPDIAVNVILPGAVEEYSDNLDPEFLQRRIGQLPAGKLGSTAQILETLHFLLGCGLTGQEIFVDGGEHLI